MPPTYKPQIHVSHPQAWAQCLTFAVLKSQGSLPHCVIDGLIGGEPSSGAQSATTTVAARESGTKGFHMCLLKEGETFRHQGSCHLLRKGEKMPEVMHTALILALRSRCTGDLCEFRVSLVYMVKPCFRKKGKETWEKHRGPGKEDRGCSGTHTHEPRLLMATSTPEAEARPEVSSEGAIPSASLFWTSWAPDS